ncbi:MAG TPA: polysaccharide deacetylase family protein [Terrimicrobiaceae bacterium]|nr:polysaccharide deacetylase family protein [Terrimicrobiaceae bacterium]
MSKRIPFLWTNDDIAYGEYEAMARMLEFLEPYGVPGTFFVVPRPSDGQPLTDDPALIHLLKSAVRLGHECHQHSTTHVCVENGTADLRMYDLMGDRQKAEHSAQRFVLERLWQVDAIEAQVAWGREVWIDAFGAPSEGFRPGCGAFCRNLYHALENLGFQWSSSRLASLTGWRWIAGKDDYPVSWEGPVRPVRIGGLMEYPILDDIAFRVPQEKIGRFADLGWQHFQKCVAMDWPFLLVSHPFALDHGGGTGYEVHRRLLRRILDSGLAEPMTIGTYHRRILSGEFPLADPDSAYAEEVYPDWHVWSRTGGPKKSH